MYKIADIILVVILSINFTILLAADRIPPSYDINLDEQPELRWKLVMKDYGKYAPAVKDMARLMVKADLYTDGELGDDADWSIETFGQSAAFHICCPSSSIKRNFVPRFLQPITWKLGEFLSYLIEDELQAEMKGIAKYSGVEYGEVVLLNILYDLTAFDRSRIVKACTSVVVQTSEGHIYHGRNLDYNMQDLIRNMTIFVNYKINGKVVAQGPSFAFYVGMLTGQKPNKFTVSLNERYSGSWLTNLLMAIYTRIGHPVSFLTRKVLIESPNYDAAVAQLSTTKIMAACYYIVAGPGPNQGVVITRDRWAPADIYALNGTHRWYVLETNYDRWKPTRKSDHRRFEAQKLLNETGPGRMSADNLYMILSTDPVLNNLTIFTTLMSPQDGGLMGKYTKVRQP